MKEINQGRRQFLKSGFWATAVASVLPLVGIRGLRGEAQAAALPMLSETDSLAVALGYYASAAKVDTAKWPKKAGADGKTQQCSNCMFYTASAGGKDGNCQIFPKNRVAAAGWCNSWAKKPA